MKLFYTPGACSLAPHIVLREAGLDFELRKVDLKTKMIEGGGNFMQINRKGYVPALQLDDGQVLTEAPVVVQYIADLRPEANLGARAGTMERYRLQEALNFVTSEIHKTFSPLFNPDAAPQWKQGAREYLARRFDILAADLATREFLVGDGFSVADAYLFTILSWARFVEFDLGRWPALQAYLRRIGSRPKVQEALRVEGLAK